MKRQVLWVLAGIALATLGHFLVWKLAPQFAPGVDLFLVATLLASIRGGQVEGMLVGLAAGTIADAVSGGPFGLHGFALTLSGYLVGLAADRVAEMTELAAGLLALIGAMVERLLLVGLLYLFVADLPALTWWWQPLIVATTLVLVWLTRIAGYFGGRLFGWQKGRQREKLRL